MRRAGSRQCNIVDKEHVKEIIAKAVSQQQEEDKDLEKRQHNIIIYRVPEKRSDIFAERKEHDTEFVKDLTDSVFSYKLEDSEIDRMYRLGRWSGDERLTGHSWCHSKMWS